MFVVVIIFNTKLGEVLLYVVTYIVVKLFLLQERNKSVRNICSPKQKSDDKKNIHLFAEMQ